MKIDLAAKISENIFSIIEMVGRTADEEKLSAYIVGGHVRDLLLNLPNNDLDFVVEGDGILFAEILNKKIKGELKTYMPFRTATIAYNDLRIDIVTARSEAYKKPAAYPDTKHGTIKEDLFRRDFTINAMAVSVNSKDFGELADFYNGLGDLKKGVIRVLHDKSFFDDPTRIFRAVRFSTRFNFGIEQHTMKLIKEALSENMLGEVNRGRIKKEVELFLKEKDPAKCLEVFSKLL